MITFKTFRTLKFVSDRYSNFETKNARYSNLFNKITSNPSKIEPVYPVVGKLGMSTIADFKMNTTLDQHLGAYWKTLFCLICFNFLDFIFFSAFWLKKLKKADYIQSL